jgi:hypothetical protein
MVVRFPSEPPSHKRRKAARRNAIGLSLVSLSNIVIPAREGSSPKGRDAKRLGERSEQSPVRRAGRALVASVPLKGKNNRAQGRRSPMTKLLSAPKNPAPSGDHHASAAEAR